MKFVYSFVFFALVGLGVGAPAGVVFDSDMANDCDDAGALAVLHGLEDLGKAEILAILTNRKDPSGASAAACAAINRYYGRARIPIGTDKDGAKTKGRTLLKYKLHTDQELFDKAYGYIREYY